MLNVHEILVFTSLGESDLVTKIFLILPSPCSFFLLFPFGTSFWYFSKRTTVTDTFLWLPLLLLPLTEEGEAIDGVEGFACIM